VVLTVVIAVGAFAAIIAVALLAGGGGGETTTFPQGSAPTRTIGDLDRAAEAARCSLSDPKSEGKTETGGTVEYVSDPPHSGDHAPEPPQDGAYRTDPPPDEALVHALLHGRVVIWFKPDLADAELGGLKALFDEAPEHVLLVRRDSMEPQVAATAWTHKLTCPQMSESVYDALRAFRDTWRDQGPEFVP
jgi:hypothetical protein